MDDVTHRTVGGEGGNSTHGKAESE
jgi:hypothetical protein